MKVSMLRVAAFLLLLSATAFGQQAGLVNFNLDFAGGGARAEGMGKAYLGISDDIYGGSWNPAGLFNQDIPIIGVSWGLLAPRGNTTTSLANTAFTDLKHSTSFSDISALSFSAPVRVKGHKIVGSINYTRNYDEYESSALNWTQPMPIAPDSIRAAMFDGTSRNDRYVDLAIANNRPNNEASVTTFNEIRGGLYTVNFGFGTKIRNNLSFGATINIYTGQTTSEAVEIDSLPNVANDGISSGQEALFVFTYRAIDSVKFTGINFNIGFKYLGEKLTAGLLLRTPLSLNTRADSTRIWVLEVNNLLITDRSRQVLSPKINPHLTKYGMPLMIGLGFGYQATERLLLAMDMEYRAYGKASIRIRDSLIIASTGSNTEFFTEFDADTASFMQWKDAIVLRFGAEYIKETEFGAIPIRAGFGYVPVPPASQTLNGDASTQVNYNLAAGSGIHWEQIHLDASYTYTIRDRDGVTTLVNGVAGSEHNYRNHHINLSFTGFF